ncbi:MAG: ATP-binding cassette domain-containing protein [Bacteroidales bacterium]|nr:ATP-binding cassette domain-containing protein [Bacteroidales bacterium]
MRSCLEVDSVIHSFGNNQILADIWLKCETGDVIGILGRNGTGKSTLLKIIFGTLRAYNSGIRINGVKYDCPYKHKGLVAYLPQHRFLPKHTSLRRIVNRFVPDRTSQEEILNNEHLRQHLSKNPGELSGGELRYFELLLLLNSGAQFLLLDEPFSGLEPIYRERVKELILNNKHNHGFIITDHDYHSILDVSTSVRLIFNSALKRIDHLEQLEAYNYVPEGTFTVKYQ